MKLFVTGGAGFIGSNYVNYVAREYPDEAIWVYDSLTYAGVNFSRDCHVSDILSRISFIHGDLRDNKGLKNSLNEVQPDVIVHFAAETHVDNSIKEPSIFVQSNVVGTYNLLQCARELKLKKFIHISTDEVCRFPKNFTRVDETVGIDPSSPYSASKAGAEALCRAYFKTWGIPVSILRLCNTYGPGQHSEKLIPSAITKFMGGIPMPVYGTGGNMRQWMYVSDAVRAVHLAVEKAEPGSLYHISNYEERTNLFILGYLLEIMKLEEDRRKLLTYVPDRLGHDEYYALNSDKFRKDMEWEPQVKLDHGLRQLVKDYGWTN